MKYISLKDLKKGITTTQDPVSMPIEASDGSDTFIIFSNPSAAPFGIETNPYHYQIFQVTPDLDNDYDPISKPFNYDSTQYILGRKLPVDTD